MRTIATLLAACALAGLPRSALGESTEPLKIGVAGQAPFVVTSSRAIDGISVELWVRAAAEAGLSYELTPVASVEDLIDGVAAGRFEAGIGPISVVASRARIVEFGQPYHRAGMGLLARTKPASFASKLAVLMSKAFVYGAGVLLLVLFAVGNLIWLAERKHNADQFPGGYAHGVLNGMWFALVTMSTVGYGDRAPATWPGRLVASIWILIAMVMASSLTAGIATVLTVWQLEEAEVASLSDLADRPVAVVAGTTGSGVAERYGGRPVEVATLRAAIDRVESGTADAVLFDLPALQHHFGRNQRRDLALVDTREEEQDYAFVFPPGSALRRKIDVAVLELAERGVLARIKAGWLGQSIAKQ